MCNNNMEVDYQHQSHMSPDVDANDPDGEGVWSPEIEQSFQEALILFPPCGRRKHILQEEGGGKMYGRNELISRHILQQTGKYRTRKQVSSHIQVLARRRAKVDGGSSVASESGTPSPSSGIRQLSLSSSLGGQNQHQFLQNNQHQLSAKSEPYYDVWTDRPIVTQRIRLVEFSAFIEHRNSRSPGHQTSQSLPATGMAPGADLAVSSSLAAYTFQNCHTQPQQQQQQPNAAYNHNNQPDYRMDTHQQQLQFAANNNQHLALLGSGAIPGHDGPYSIMHNPQVNANSPNPLVCKPNFLRHSYCSIDYSHLTKHQQQQFKKLERIDVTQIQDKFPDLAGPNGLFQRCPADGFYLVKFWADISNDHNIDDQNSYFGFSSHFETIDLYKDVTCSTKACSYGQQVVEKMDKLCPKFNETNGRYSYAINRSPMCEFMIQFIKKLRQLPRTSQMNSVLENFTVLQVITSESSGGEILLCLAYVFEIDSTSTTSISTNGPAQGHRALSSHHVYRLTKD